VARLLKLNTQTLRNWIIDGSLPCVREGRRVFIRREDLEKLVGTSDIAPGSFLTVDEVARQFRLNPQTVRNAIDDGRLTAFHVGRRVRIRRADLESYATPVRWRSLATRRSAGVERSDGL
jgi:excisionase family DNA binding protein